MNTAYAELRQREIIGEANNEHIVEYLQSTNTPSPGDEVDWSSAFVVWVVEKSGYKGTKSNVNRAWRTQRRITILAGNQNNEMSISNLRRSTFLGCVWPSVPGEPYPQLSYFLSCTNSIVVYSYEGGEIDQVKARFLNKFLRRRRPFASYCRVFTIKQALNFAAPSTSSRSRGRNCYKMFINTKQRTVETNAPALQVDRGIHTSTTI